MPVTVLSYADAAIGIPFPQHKAGKTGGTQNFLFPGAVQPKTSLPTVLSYIDAFPGMPFPNRTAGQTLIQSFLYPGALQPDGAVARLVFSGQTISIPILMTVPVKVTVT